MDLAVCLRGARQAPPRPLFPFFALCILVLFLSSAALPLAAEDAWDDPCTVLYHKLQNYSQLADDGPKKQFVFARPSEIVNCTRSVAFEADRDLGTLETVTQVFRSFYSLLHLAQQSPDPGLPSEYDVIGELGKLKAEDWESAEEFYGALAGAVDGLDDGHTGLDVSCPPFAHMLALPLVGVVESGTHVVRAVPETLLIPSAVDGAFQSPFEFDPTRYTGAKVLQIDGQAAWDYMVSWADANAHKYHDLGQKLNHAFAHLKWVNGTRSRSYGAFGTRYANPGADFVRLKLVRQGAAAPEVVDVPWLSYTPTKSIKGFADSTTYAKSFRYPKKPEANPPPAPMLQQQQQQQQAEGVLEAWTTAAGGIRSLLQKRVSQGNKGSKAHMRGGLPSLNVGVVHKGDVIAQLAGPTGGVPQGGEELLRALSRVPLRMAKRKGTPKRFRMKGNTVELQLSQATLVSEPGDYWKVYKLSDGKTAVVCLSNFLPNLDMSTIKSYVEFLGFYAYETAKALYTADLYGEQVIIDLSRNGGGATILVPWAMELIKGTLAYPRPRSDMSHFLQFLADTDLVLQLRKRDAGAYNWSSYADVNEVPFNESTADQFFYPVESHKYGVHGLWGRYSSFFKEANPSLSELLEIGLHSAWGDKPLLLFSDGQCFSACSSFATSMKERFGTKMVAIGGLPSRPMAFSAAGGGFVSEDVAEDILSAIPPALAHSPDAPGDFGVRMSLSLRWVNGFMQADSAAPIEFTFVPADHKIDYTLENLVDPSLQYLEAAKFFD